MNPGLARTFDDKKFMWDGKIYEIENEAKVLILSCQVQHIPDEVQPGLSPALEDAVPRAAKLLAEKYF